MHAKLDAEAAPGRLLGMALARALARAPRGALGTYSRSRPRVWCSLLLLRPGPQYILGNDSAVGAISVRENIFLTQASISVQDGSQIIICVVFDFDRFSAGETSVSFRSSREEEEEEEIT